MTIPTTSTQKKKKHTMKTVCQKCFFNRVGDPPAWCDEIYTDPNIVDLCETDQKRVTVEKLKNKILKRWPSWYGLGFKLGDHIQEPITIYTESKNEVAGIGEDGLMGIYLKAYTKDMEGNLISFYIFTTDMLKQFLAIVVENSYKRGDRVIES